MVAYEAGMYLVLPAVWERSAHRHPSLDVVPGMSTTGADIPGDLLNVALTGTKAELVRIMLAAKRNGCADEES